MEAYLKELYKKFSIESINYDPFQFHRSGVSLAKEGLPMKEYAQSQSNLVEAGENLYSLIKGRNLSVYKDREVRDHVLKSIAQESSRGFRLVKSKQSERIDLAIALAMASVKAVDLDTGRPRIRSLDSPDDEGDNDRNWVDIGGSPGGNLLPEEYHQI